MDKSNISSFGKRVKFRNTGTKNNDNDHVDDDDHVDNNDEDHNTRIMNKLTYFEKYLSGREVPFQLLESFCDKPIKQNSTVQLSLSTDSEQPK